MDVLLALIPIGFGGLLAAAGIFLFCLGWLTRGFDRQIAAQGVDTQAEITAHRTQMAKKGTARVYTLTTTYRVPAATGDGLPQTFTQESEVSAADYERLNPGDQV